MSTTNEGYVDLGSPTLNALRDARRAAGEAEGITETERWFMLDQSVREYIVMSAAESAPAVSRPEGGVTELHLAALDHAIEVYAGPDDDTLSTLHDLRETLAPSEPEPVLCDLTPSGEHHPVRRMAGRRIYRECMACGITLDAERGGRS